LFRDTDPEVRNAALSFAATSSILRGQCGLAAAPVLRRVIIENEDERTRDKAVLALVSIGPDVVPFLMDSLTDSSPSVRKTAAYALGQLGEASRAALPSLVLTVKDENEEVRRDAAIALFLIDRVAARAAGVD
jgi:HEAT repeat protein